MLFVEGISVVFKMNSRRHCGIVGLVCGRLGDIPFVSSDGRGSLMYFGGHALKLSQFVPSIMKCGVGKTHTHTHTHSLMGKRMQWIA